MTVSTLKVMQQVMAEIDRARDKFPSPECSMTALTEEVGELATALMDEQPARVIEEAVQVAVMAIRIATEGDPTINPYRQRHGLPAFPEVSIDGE